MYRSIVLVKLNCWQYCCLGHQSAALILKNNRAKVIKERDNYLVGTTLWVCHFRRRVILLDTVLLDNGSKAVDLVLITCSDITSGSILTFKVFNSPADLWFFLNLFSTKNTYMCKDSNANSYMNCAVTSLLSKTKLIWLKVVFITTFMIFILMIWSSWLEFFERGRLT